MCFSMAKSCWFPTVMWNEVKLLMPFALEIFMKHSVGASRWCSGMLMVRCRVEGIADNEFLFVGANVKLEKEGAGPDLDKQHSPSMFGPMRAHRAHPRVAEKAQSQFLKCKHAMKDKTDRYAVEGIPNSHCLVSPDGHTLIATGVAMLEAQTDICNGVGHVQACQDNACCNCSRGGLPFVKIPNDNSNGVVEQEAGPDGGSFCI